MKELFIRLIASLNRTTSRVNIQKDVTQLERTPFIIRLQGQLDKSRTAARLRRDLQQAGKNQTITVDAKVSRSSLERSLDEARQQIHTEPIEIPVTADVAALQNAGQAQRDIINSGSGLRNVIQNYVNWNRVLDLVVQAMKKAVSKSSELAKAQTELQIVTGKSNSEMQSLMSGYNALAQDLSVTTTDITSAADEWLRTGKSISDTEKLITDSTILAKIGQLDTAEATKYLTSMMKGFKVETDDVIGIVDRLNAVDMAAAVTSGGLAEAMSKCANSAEIANISMDSLVGYIAAVKEVTQDSDSVVGNAFKSMFSRMGNPNSINLNNVYGIGSHNYFKKYCGSTALLIYSLFDIPLPPTDMGKALLLTIDSTYYSYYNPIAKKRPEWLEIHRHWLCDILELPELYELECAHKMEDFRRFGFINDAKIQIFDDVLDGYYQMLYPLDYKYEVEKALDVCLDVPSDSFRLLKGVRAKSCYLDGLHKTDLKEKYNIVSFAMTGKNHCNFSVVEK